METTDFISKQDHTKKTILIDGYEIVASFSDERKPDAFQIIKRILLSSSTPKTIDAA